MKLKLVHKAILMVVGVISIYTIAISLFTIPKIDKSIEILEEKNAKVILDKITLLTTNANIDLMKYKKQTLQKHKDELKNLTDTAWSIIRAKYDESKPKNIGNLLKQRAKEFEQNLINFYNKNQKIMTKNQLKKAIKNYINIYRYDSSIGYFWINDHKPNMILHPIIPKLNGKYLGNYKDQNGVYLFNKMVEVCQKNGSGIVKYQWLNPKNNQIEPKISYVFNFKPFNWIIGTGEYTSVLKKRLQNEVIDIVKTLRYGNGNYFFIYDYNNIAISHPYIQGKDMSNAKDKKGNLIVPPFIKIAKTQGEGYSQYWWQKNSKDSKSYEKLIFVKNFKDWKMVIATGIFIDDINQEVEIRKKEMISQLSKIIKTTKIGKNGYLYIFDGSGKMIIHPNDNLNGINFKKLKDPQSNTYLFDDLVKASKTKEKMFKYKWDMPSDKGNYIYDKISWIQYIPELDWYVGSSIYVDEFKESSRDVGSFIFIFSIIALILSTIISIVFFRKLLKPISNLSQISLSVANGNYNVRCKLKQNDEIGVLANSFNKMIDTIEDLINNLDHKIASRTKDLTIAKIEIEETHKHIQDSIEYASLIQSALIPLEGAMLPYFKDHFVTWTPKDTVGGDIWLLNDLRHKDECLLLFIDCTGHGVPGAFITMIVKAVEKEITTLINSNPDMEISPAKIMKYFNISIKQLLRQETKDSLSNAGFDGGIIYYNRRTQILKFAGAETPLFYMTKDGELKTIKGNRYSVGYKKCDIDYEYKESIIEVSEGMKFYCTTDGYLDQNGGLKDFPFGKKRFSNIIKKYSDKPMSELKTIFSSEMKSYEETIKNNDRNDDITLIAFEIGKRSKFKKHTKQEIVKYKGIITQNVIASCMDNIEAKIKELSLKNIISTITIEYCQNMMNYSKNEDINSRQIVPIGAIEVENLNNEYYEIIATNIVSIDDKLKIEPKLLDIQSLDKEGIRKRYLEFRKSGQNTHEKGGGFGMYEIAKVSNSIEYRFKKINEDKYYFTMKSIVRIK